MSGTGDEVTVGIPRVMYERIQRKILGTSYGSVQEYVTAVLQQTLVGGTSGGEAQGLSEEDERAMKEKLRALGYL